jgi:hypothetical protein
VLGQRPQAPALPGHEDGRLEVGLAHMVSERTFTMPRMRLVQLVCRRI